MIMVKLKTKMSQCVFGEEGLKSVRFFFFFLMWFSIKRGNDNKTLTCEMGEFCLGDDRFLQGNTALLLSHRWVKVI